MSTSTTSTLDVSTEERSRVRRAVVASSVGNALEWFDIIVYASFAVVISKLFFPTQSGATGLLLTFGTFAISYLIRPIGAMVIGAYGDRAGRKQALSLTIFAMMLGHRDHGVRAHCRLHRRLGRRGHPRVTAAPGVLGRWRVRHGHGVPHRERPRPQGVLRQLAGGHPGRWRCSWPRRSASA